MGNKLQAFIQTAVRLDVEIFCVLVRDVEQLLRIAVDRTAVVDFKLNAEMTQTFAVEHEVGRVIVLVNNLTMLIPAGCAVGVQVYFKADADKDNGRDCGFRTVLLNPQHKGFKYFQPAGGIAIAFDDMKTLQAHALMQAMHGGEYICNFEMGAKVDGIINAVLKSVKSGTWEKC